MTKVRQPFDISQIPDHFVRFDVNGQSLTTTQQGYARTNIGAEAAFAAGTTAQYRRGDKTWQTLNTSVVPESGNLYFTEARVRATVLTGYAVGANTALAAGDSILAAMGKIQAQLNNKQASGSYLTVESDTLATVLARGNSSSDEILITAVGTNTTIGVDSMKLSGFGLMGNRSAMYVTNNNAGGTIVFGVGGVHNATNKLMVHSTGITVYGTIIKSGGTSAQFLKADGSVDTTAYQPAGSYAAASHTHPWSQITSTPTTLAGYGITDAVPSTRTITINGTTFDLSANRSWTISSGGSGTVTSVSGTGGYGGLTLSGTVTSSGNITLGGTPSGTWPIDINGFSAAVGSGTIADLNTAWTTPGSSISNALYIYRYSSGAVSAPVNVNNANWLLNIYSHPSGGTASYGHQIAAADNESIYFRKVSNGAFSAWRELLHTGNFNPSTGILVKTSAGNYVSRSLDSGTGISITYANGDSGNPSIALSSAFLVDRTFISKGVKTVGAYSISPGTAVFLVGQSNFDWLSSYYGIRNGVYWTSHGVLTKNTGTGMLNFGWRIAGSDVVLGNINTFFDGTQHYSLRAGIHIVSSTSAKLTFEFCVGGDGTSGWRFIRHGQATVNFNSSFSLNIVLQFDTVGLSNFTEFATAVYTY